MARLAPVWRRKTLNRALTHLRNLRLSAIYDVPGLPSGRGHLSYKEVQQSSILWPGTTRTCPSGEGLS